MADLFLQALEERRLKRDAERSAMVKRSAQLNAEADADAVAKRVYLETIAASPSAPAAAVPDDIEPSPAPPIFAAPVSDTTGKPMVKDMILSVLRDAYPHGLSAAQIKAKAYLRFKQHINPNTLTVSLGRYSKPKPGEAKLAKCDGRVWYYIRQGEPEKTRSPELALINGGRNAAG